MRRKILSAVLIAVLVAGTAVAPGWAHDTEHTA